MNTSAIIIVQQVDMMMLDLDVGFIDDPMHMVRKLHNSKSDIFVQVYSYEKIVRRPCCSLPVLRAVVDPTAYN